MDEKKVTYTVVINDALLEFANYQNTKLQKALIKRALYSGGMALLITLISVLLTIDATEIRLSKPVLVSASGNVQIVEPVFNIENTLRVNDAIVRRYAESLMTFHFRKLEPQLQARRKLFISDDVYESVYRSPLQESGAFERILSNNLIVTAASIRNADLVGEYMLDSNRMLKYKIRMVQTIQGPSDEPETNSLTVIMTLKKVSRDKAIDGLLINDLGTLR